MSNPMDFKFDAQRAIWAIKTREKMAQAEQRRERNKANRRKSNGN